MSGYYTHPNDKGNQGKLILYNRHVQCRGKLCLLLTTGSHYRRGCGGDMNYRYVILYRMILEVKYRQVHV